MVNVGVRLCSCCLIMLSLYGCQEHIPRDKIEISAKLTSDDIFGLTLNIENRSDRQICIPVSTLSSESGSVLFDYNGLPVAIKKVTEFPDVMPKEGPYYILFPHSNNKLPVDTNSLTIEQNQTYSYEIFLHFEQCNRIAQENSFKISGSRKLHISGRIKYTASF